MMDCPPPTTFKSVMMDVFYGLLMLVPALLITYAAYNSKSRAEEIEVSKSKVVRITIISCQNPPHLKDLPIGTEREPYVRVKMSDEEYKEWLIWKRVVEEWEIE